jgi:hypothetical protein
MKQASSTENSVPKGQDIYSFRENLQANKSAYCLLLPGFLFGLLFDRED